MYSKSLKSVSEICPVSEHAFKYFSDVKKQKDKVMDGIIQGQCHSIYEQAK